MKSEALATRVTAIGARLKEARKKADMTQRQAVETVNQLPNRTPARFTELAALESGHGDPTLGFIMDLAGVYRADLDYILTGGVFEEGGAE